MIRIDLGSGPRTPDGFLGIDRFPLPNVQVVADLNQPLPLKADSVDLLLASHSLEHVEDLMKTMSEIFRVCKHGAQVCIVAPYFSQGINFANPYHKQAFNEHTPRFWTRSSDVFINQEEYNHPHANTWGLSQSDYSQQGFDFRCLKMEFLYFPEYRWISPDAQRDARKKFLDVADQIIYYLIAIKEEASRSAMETMIQHLEPFEPPGVTVRKLRDKLELLTSNLEAVKADLQAQQKSARDELDSQRLNLHRTLEALASLEDVGRDRDQKLEELKAILETARREVVFLKETNGGMEIKNKELDREAQRSRSSLKLWMSSAKNLARNLDAFRERKSVRFIDGVFRSKDLRHNISPPFKRFLDDSAIYIPGLSHYILNLSSSLYQLPFQEYPLDAKREGLEEIAIGVSVEVPHAEGQLALEIIAPDGQVIRMCEIELNAINVNMPVSFVFKPLQDSEVEEARLRITSRSSDVPIRFFQWERSSFRGLVKTHARLFCGYRFNILSV